ncbi:PAS domain S-box protein [bacterium]|nr:PAS domain S-box protein [bacterium]
MSIRYKYLLLIPLTALLPILVFYFFSNRYITTGLLNIQRNRMLRDVPSVSLELATEGNSIAAEAESNSRNDALYEFITGSDEETVGPDWNAALTLSDPEILYAILDDEGNIVYRKGRWNPSEIYRLALITKRERMGLRRQHSLERLSGGLALVASSHLLRSDGSGEPYGQLLLAKKIDDSFGANLSLTIKSPFTIYSGQTAIASGNMQSDPGVLDHEFSDMLLDRFMNGEDAVWIPDASTFGNAVYTPLLNSSQAIVGVLKIASLHEDLLPVKLNLNRASIVIFVVVALITVTLAFTLSLYMGGRITRLSLATRDILYGDSIQNIQPAKYFRDELDELLISFARMKDDLDNYLRQLIQSEVKYKRVVNSSISGVFVYSGGRYKFSNPKFEAITGYSLEELNKMEPLGYIKEEDRDSFVENIVLRLSREWQQQPADTRIITKSGDEKILNIRTEKIEYEGEPALLGHLVDVTTQRVLERKLFHTQKLEAIGTLAGGIAHDFNNVIGGIIGFAEMLEERYPEDAQISKITGRILKLGHRGSKLVKNLLAFARGEISARETVDVEEAVARVLDIFVLPRHLGIKVKTEFPSPKAYLHFDLVQFEQMLINLLLNARDALPDGGTIEIRVERPQEKKLIIDGNEIEIMIIDNGEGIPEKSLAKIFDPFFSTKEVGKGTGLGLAVVYGIVEIHGGKIDVQSDVGRGTTFIVTFPEAAAPDFRPEIMEMSGDIEMESVEKAGSD